MVRREKKVLRTPIFDIKHLDVRDDNSRRHSYYVIESQDWVNVVPITAEKRIIMVKQFRAGIQGFTLEVPGGMVEKGEKHMTAALREMEEETGYRIETRGTCLSLGWCHPNPAILDNKCYFYLASPVTWKSQQMLDRSESIEVLEITTKEIRKWIKNRKITHALTLTALFLANNSGQVNLRI